MWPSILWFDLPGKNPGTSTNVTIGMLKESQNLTNLAPLTEAFISKQPGNIDKNYINEGLSILFGLINCFTSSSVADIFVRIRQIYYGFSLTEKS